MKRIALVAVLVFAAILQSCGDSSTTPPTTNVTPTNYLPLTVGNYWLMDRITLDTITGLQTGPSVVDSVVITRSLTYNGRTAFEAIYITQGSSELDTSYFSKGTDGSIYTWFEFNLPLIASLAPTLKIPTFWLQVKNADGGPDTWTSLDTTIKNVNVTVSGTPIPMDLRFTVNNRKGTDSTVTLNAKTYTTKEFVSTFSVTAYSAGSQNVVLSASIPSSTRFIDAVGIYRSRTNNSAITSLLGTLARLPGSQSTLTNFVLK